MIPTTHEKHIFCGFKCKNVFFLFDKFHRSKGKKKLILVILFNLLISVSKIPYKHASHTSTENIFTISGEFN